MELSKVTMILRGYTYEQVRCVAAVSYTHLTLPTTSRV